MGELVTWLDTVTIAGAEAIYARIYREPLPFVEALLNRLNQHGELALLAPAQLYVPELYPSGWHFRGEAPNRLPPDAARYLGRSCHSLQDVLSAQAEGMDYVFLSPVFSTKTHPDAIPLGIEKLREVCAQVDIPVFALGGITPEREKQCLDAGAYGIAAIRMFSK